MWNNRICLASSSPRRREMFAWIGIPFQAVSADVDESPLESELPTAHVMRLAQAKAEKGMEISKGNTLVVAADTIVTLGEQILGKPVDARDAESMLDLLRGRTHQVITALSVIVAGKGKTYSDQCITKVEMRAYSEEEVRFYIATGDPLDKAGGYAIQHPVFNPVVNFNGCFASVMGLPLCHLERIFRNIDGYPIHDMPEICKKNVGYTCPIFQRVLAGEEIG